MKRWLLYIVITGLAVFAQDSGSSTKSQTAVDAADEVGSHLPKFVVKDFDGREVSSVNLTRKVVIIDFWATWCDPCKQEMPGYQELLDRYGSHGLVIIGLKSDAMADTEIH
jgi:thiol-disulfide isomerase/thioredoxin